MRILLGFLIAGSRGFTGGGCYIVTGPQWPVGEDSFVGENRTPVAGQFWVLFFELLPLGCQIVPVPNGFRVSTRRSLPGARHLIATGPGICPATDVELGQAPV